MYGYGVIPVFLAKSIHAVFILFVGIQSGDIISYSIALNILDIVLRILPMQSR